jgi:ABC-2 type transport system permease protein
MSGTLTIFKKEIKGFIFAPTFWVISFLLSVVFSWVYPIQLDVFAKLLMNYVMQQGVSANQLNIHFGLFLRLIPILNLLLILVIPALTMKLFAEEKKMRTFDLLLTSPVTSVEIVMGKFLASLGAVLGLILVAFAYPLATAAIAHINWGPLFIAFFGIFLTGAVYAAMDLFCSSLTENSLIAYAASVILNISIWFIGIGAEVVDSEGARKIFEHVSLATHLSSLMEGTIRTNGLIFFISIIVLFCFLAERVVESSRWR